MQRHGSVLPQNDFMTDIAERLNLESAKLVKQESEHSNLSKEERKGKKSEEKELRKKL
jgi:hypothetical protein